MRDVERKSTGVQMVTCVNIDKGQEEKTNDRQKKSISFVFGLSYSIIKKKRNEQISLK
jgi:hypothetical protein